VPSSELRPNGSKAITSQKGSNGERNADLSDMSEAVMGNPKG
jgi:hypothetical protein